MAANLKGCPFCEDGGAPEVNYGCGGSKAYVKCYGCGIYTPSFKTRREAEVFWNTRRTDNGGGENGKD